MQGYNTDVRMILTKIVRQRLAFHSLSNLASSALRFLSTLEMDVDVVFNCSAKTVTFYVDKIKKKELNYIEVLLICKSYMTFQLHCFAISK